MVREIHCSCVIRLLRAYDKEASEEGKIKDTAAKVAGLAFKGIFGSDKEKMEKTRKRKPRTKSPRKIWTTKWNRRKQQ